jgi:hypothetical protein
VSGKQRYRHYWSWQGEKADEKNFGFEWSEYQYAGRT